MNTPIRYNFIYNMKYFFHLKIKVCCHVNLYFNFVMWTFVCETNASICIVDKPCSTHAGVHIMGLCATVNTPACV